MNEKITSVVRFERTTKGLRVLRSTWLSYTPNENFNLKKIPISKFGSIY